MDEFEQKFYTTFIDFLRYFENILFLRIGKSIFCRGW